MPHLRRQQADWHQRTRYNPLRGLTAEILSAQLERYERGDIAAAAMLWDAILRRDDTLAVVGPKRLALASGRAWQVQIAAEYVGTPREAEAQAQVAEVEYLLRHLRVTDALDGDYDAGFEALAEHIVRTRFYGRGLAELIWRPSLDGWGLEVRRVPLWFAEATTGKLRWVTQPGSLTGRDCAPGEWLVTSHDDALMMPAANLYLRKSLAWKDQLLLSLKFGIPYVYMATSAAYGSPEWDAAVDALAEFGNDGQSVMAEGSTLTALEVSATGAPMQAILESSQRAMITLFMGSDLATMSSQDGMGASLQGESGSTLEESDAAYICATINNQILPYLLRQRLGSAERLVEVTLPAPDSPNVQQDILIDQHLQAAGVRLDLADMAERYGRKVAETAPPVPTPAPQPAPLANAEPEPEPMTFEQAGAQIAAALHADLQPLAERLAALAKRLDASSTEPLTKADRDELKALLDEIDAAELPEATVEAFEEFFAEALLQGFAAQP